MLSLHICPPRYAYIVTRTSVHRNAKLRQSSILPPTRLTRPPPCPLSSPSLPVPKDPVLHPQAHITRKLKQTTSLEGPRNATLGGSKEEEDRLHHVAQQPTGQDGEAETPAGPRALVGDDLGEGEDGFNAEGEIADQRRVGWVRGEEELADEQAEDEVEECLPVSVPPRAPWTNLRLRRPPLPEIPRPHDAHFPLARPGEGRVVDAAGFGAGRGPVVQGDFQEEELHGYHYQGLDQERGVKVGAEPVEYSGGFSNGVSRLVGEGESTKDIGCGVVGGGRGGEERREEEGSGGGTGGSKLRA
ncbi:MAG: hypothetical protein M1827_000335 [Pycnora praestabilis]|nr:MAG: hypothetical protein M1827_000335 [Pycnora praestabilis]